MKHKIKNITLAAFVGLFTLYACDLETVPESNLSDAVFWQSDQDFRQATNALYKVSDINPIHEEYPLIADAMSDNGVFVPYSTISNGTYLPSSNFGPWDQDYEIIRAANNIIEKADAATFESNSLPRFRGEAKFFRAYAYADLVRRYGAMPLIMRTLDINDKDLYSPRSDREVVTDTIYNDLDYAAAHLPAASELYLPEQYGMATRGAALALKSRVALREGTWNKFHENANFQGHLQIAKEAAMQVIQSGEYQLYDMYGTDSFRQLFKLIAQGPENKEGIWTWLYGPSEATPIRIHLVSTLIQGTISVTRSLVDAYLCTDGLPIDKSPLYQGQQNALSEFQNRDPRLNGTVIKKGDIYGNSTGTPYVPNLTAPTGYYITKYYDVYGEKSPVTIDVMMIRYAEVLLNYAEAAFELNDAISDEDLDISINLLRDRVGMPHLTNAFVSANGLNMRDEIRRERRVELGMEGFRYDDLLRWKTAEVELPKATEGVRLFAAEYPGVDPSNVNLTADSIVVVEPASKRSFNPSEQYLWPLPVNQLALNPKALV